MVGKMMLVGMLLQDVQTVQTILLNLNAVGIEDFHFIIIDYNLMFQ